VTPHKLKLAKTPSFKIWFTLEATATELLEIK
jgi:hypothetical protein